APGPPGSSAPRPFQPQNRPREDVRFMAMSPVRATVAVPPTMRWKSCDSFREGVSDGGSPADLDDLVAARARQRSGGLAAVSDLYTPLVRFWAACGGVPLADSEDVVQEVF